MRMLKMMKWNKCSNCFHDGKCQNQNVEQPCGKVLEDMYNSNSQELDYLRAKVKLAETLFELIGLSKKRPELIGEEKITDLALELFCLHDKECVDNERSIN